jgi:hypothetical protein
VTAAERLAEALENMSRHALRHMTADEEEAVKAAAHTLRELGAVREAAEGLADDADPVEIACQYAERKSADRGAYVMVGHRIDRLRTALARVRGGKGE